MVRTILRNIAKNRLKDMGYDNVNSKMRLRFGDKDTMPCREAINKLQKTPQGRGRLEKSLKEHPALWTEVLCGSKKKDADGAFSRMSSVRFLRRHPDRNWPKKKRSLDKLEMTQERPSQKTQTA